MELATSLGIWCWGRISSTSWRTPCQKTRSLESWSIHDQCWGQRTNPWTNETRIQWVCQWMSRTDEPTGQEWNEWINEWMNEWRKEGRKEGMNERTNERMNERVKEGTNQWASESVSESGSQSVSQSVSQSIHLYPINKLLHIASINRWMN